jgi:uncharacterized protein
LADVSDVRLNSVVALLTNEPGNLIIPSPVTAEIDYLLRRRLGTNAARAFLVDVIQTRFQVGCMTQAEHRTALDLLDRYADLDLGLADLSVIVLADRFRTHRILTFDERHFRAVRSLSGSPFTLLPSDT